MSSAGPMSGSSGEWKPLLDELRSTMAVLDVVGLPERACRLIKVRISLCAGH